MDDYQFDKDFENETENNKNSKVSESQRDIKKDKAHGAKMELFDWLQCVVFALIIGIFVFMFIGRVVTVNGSSMYPTLRHGDKLLTSNLFYSPKAGDVIVCQTDSFGPDPLVKRIIAVGGQTVSIDFNAGIVYVDGEALYEPYVSAPTYVAEDFSEPVTIPEGYLFVMGDNRNDSLDSRSDVVGLISEDWIIGKAYFIIFPGKDSAGGINYGRIGSVS